MGGRFIPLLHGPTTARAAGSLDLHGPRPQRHGDDRARREHQKTLTGRQEMRYFHNPENILS